MVLVPVVSLIIQKIQTDRILPLSEPRELWVMNGHPVDNHDMVNYDSKTFSSICKSHLIGSSIQLLASLVAAYMLTQPVFAGIAVIAGYEMINTLVKAHANPITIIKPRTANSVEHNIKGNCLTIFE